jgi:hypothetical protein
MFQSAQKSSIVCIPDVQMSRTWSSTRDDRKHMNVFFVVLCVRVWLCFRYVCAVSRFDLLSTRAVCSSRRFPTTSTSIERDQPTALEAEARPRATRQTVDARGRTRSVESASRTHACPRMAVFRLVLVWCRAGPRGRVGRVSMRGLAAASAGQGAREEDHVCNRASEDERPPDRVAHAPAPPLASSGRPPLVVACVCAVLVSVGRGWLNAAHRRRPAG